MVTFRIETEIFSPATHIMIAHNTQTNQPACLKMWLPCDNGVYYTIDLKKCNDYFMEGLNFNRKFAPHVYKGLARFVMRNDVKREVKFGRLITKPQRHQLKDDCQYALIMNRLDETARLDHHLDHLQIGNIRGMEFLAEAIADMHKRLDRSPMSMGTPASLSEKLHFNRQKFMEALHIVRKKKEFAAFKRRIGRKGLLRLMSAGESLERLAETYKHIFEHRYQAQKIYRCHGDLKATNLWLYRAADSAKDQLLCLDCVDFQPKFCHIDTLSDLAMIAIDLEMYFTHAPDNSKLRTESYKLVQHFLYTYLRVANESEAVWPLLEYYLTEKAMVCAYQRILFDRQPLLGEQYLDVVLTHLRKLDDYLPPRIEKRITRPLVLMTGETTRHG
ncbi:MAG: hypothetical protein ACRDIV_23980 [Ktedonobacteraceae bacterium]